MEPAQRPSITLESKADAQTLGSQVEEPTADGVLSWDGHASGIVFGLTLFRCDEQVVHDAFQSYGYKCSLRALEICVNRYNFLSYDRVRAPVDGPVVIKKILQSGEEDTMTIEYVKGKPAVLTQKCGILLPLVPFYKQPLYSADGRLITVEFTEGQLQIRALDRPRPRPSAASAIRRDLEHPRPRPYAPQPWRFRGPKSALLKPPSRTLR